MDPAVFRVGDPYFFSDFSVLYQQLFNEAQKKGAGDLQYFMNGENTHR